MPPEFPGGAWWPERRRWGPQTLGGRPNTDHWTAWGLQPGSGGRRKQAFVAQAPATGAITGFRIIVWFLQDTTLAGGPGLLRFSCQTLDPATGWPTGTGAFTGESTTFDVYAGGPGSPFEAVFSEPFAVTRGDLFACVWELTHWVEASTVCSFLWASCPNLSTSPFYGLQSLDGATWELETGVGGSHAMRAPAVVLLSEDPALSRATGDLMPMATRGRLGTSAPYAALTLTADMDPVGVQFTVPRSLTCDACAFNFELDLTSEARITLTGPDVAVSEDLLGVPPTSVGFGPGNWPVTFDAVILRPGETYTATLQALGGVPLEVRGARVDPDMLTDFEGGPTWVSFGDPAEIANRWFFFLHIPGPAEELPGGGPGGGGFTLRDCVVIPVCPEEEEPGPADVTPSVFAAWRPGQGPLRPRARRRPMAMVTVPGGSLILPEFYALGTATLATSFWSATVAGGRVAFIVRVPRTGTLDKFEWMCNGYTATNTVRHSFQDVDLTTGNPDGVVDEYRTGNPTTGAWFVPGLITSDGTDGGTKRSVTAGHLLACVVDFSAFTSGSVSCRVMTVASAGQHAWVGTYNGTTWTKNASYVPLLALKYSDGTYEPLHEPIWPFTAVATSAINTGTTPDEAGLRFQVPFDCVVEGVTYYVDADGDCDLVLYDASSSVLASVSLDKDVRQATAAVIAQVPLSAAVTLTRNTTYRLVCKPTSATSCTIYDTTVASVALMNAAPGGAEWYWTQRTDGGAWTDTTTRRPLGVGLRIGQIDDGDGAGGGADTATGGRFNRGMN